MNAIVEDIASGTLDGLDMWCLFHAAGFDSEEVHFTARRTSQPA